LFQIIIFATVLVAVALAMQPLDAKDENSRHHHLNHKRQLSQHPHSHQQHGSGLAEKKEHLKHGREVVDHVVSHAKGHAKSHKPHKKHHHQSQDEHSRRKARSHPSKHHSHKSGHPHKHHSASRRH
ncbi:hypothetical protein KR067_005698, partial [Drosophila pandora]